MARQMKDSGIEWIGDIPAHWQVIPHKYVMHKEKSICEHYNGEDIISLTMNGVIVRDLTAGGKMPTTFDGYQYVEPEDLLMCLFDIDVTPRCVGIVRNHGVTSPAYSRLKVHEGYYNAYYDYLLRFIDDEKVFIHLAKNLRSSLTETDFGAIKTIVPPLEEQKRIAEYLDHQCAEIDAVIAKTKATIEEYKKLKQSIITNAVTKGIRGNRPMTDSGVERIGDIPADWQVSPLQYYVELNKSTLGEDTPADYEFDYVEIGAVTLENGISEYQRYKFSDAPSRARRVVQPNDIIISTVRTYLKAIAIVPEKENVVVSTGFAVLTPRNINIDYLGFALKSEYFVHTVTANSVGISYPAINSSDLVKFKIAIPTKEEQEEIAEYLGKKCIEMDTLIAKKTALLAEMESYKQSVIYEYVTGKKEVTV